MGLCVFVFSLAAAAGPWIRAPGSFYTKASYGVFDAGSYIEPGDEGAPSSSPSFRGRTASVYTELGVLPGLQLIADVPYQWSDNRFPGGTLRYKTRGFGTGRFGLGLTHPGVQAPVALSVSARVPMFGDLRPLFPAPALGEGQLDVDMSAGAGASSPLGEGSWWGAAEIGLRARTAWVVAPYGPRGEGWALPYRLQLGWRPKLGWLYLESSGAAGLTSPRQSHQIALGSALVLWRGLQAEACLSAIWLARAEAAGRTWTLGVSHTGSLRRL